MKRFALIAALALSACQQQAAAPADPNPDAKPGLTLNEGRLKLPAVKGNPAAAYFTLVNAGAAETTIAAVSIDGAGKAEMHETKDGAMLPMPSLAIKAGETVAFAPGGKHVMAFDLTDKLAAGTSAEITLTFADGDKLSAPLKVEAAGAGADHGGMH